jgi:dodecin
VALEEAAKTVRNIQSIYVKEMQAVVENDRIVQYRINAKISFVLERSS